MKRSLTIFALLLALPMSAQFVVGSEGMTVLAITPISIDGLTLNPSTNLAIANNSIQEGNTPIAGSSSINRVYQFGAPLLFSGTVGIYYLPTELNGYTESALQIAYAPAASAPLTVTTGSTVDATNHYVSNSLTNQNLFVVTASALSDLSPILYARPSIVYGTADITVVVDVFELNSASTNGLITVRIPKDSKFSLSFSPSATSINGKPVQNNVWSFSGLSGGAYTLTTNQVIAGGGKLSVGLTGTLTPGATSGAVTATSIVVGGSGGEVRVDNNSNADKIDYFQQ